jgi:hypothetical protein
MIIVATYSFVVLAMKYCSIDSGDDHSQQKSRLGDASAKRTPFVSGRASAGQSSPR